MFGISSQFVNVYYRLFCLLWFEDLPQPLVVPVWRFQMLRTPETYGHERDRMPEELYWVRVSPVLNGKQKLQQQQQRQQQQCNSNNNSNRNNADFINAIVLNSVL